MRKKKLIIAAVAALAAGAVVSGAAAALASANGEEPTPAITATVERATVTSVVTGRGVLAAANTANASFSAGGTVTGISVMIGQTVEAGQELATIDPAAADREIEKVRGALATTEGLLANSRATLDRANKALAAAKQALAAVPAGPDAAADRETATQRVRDAEVAVTDGNGDAIQAGRARDDAKRDVQTAEAARAATVLKAPIAGVITAINGTVGSVATAGENSRGTDSEAPAGSSGFIQISDISRLRITTDIAEADIASVALGQTAEVTLSTTGAEPIGGTVVSVSPTPAAGQTEVVSYPVVIELGSVPDTARLGQTGLVSIVTAASENTLTLQSEAIALNGDGTGTVQKIGKGGKAKTAEVKVGITGDGATEILDGLAEGDEVEIAIPQGEDSPPSGMPAAEVTRREALG